MWGGSQAYINGNCHSSLPRYSSFLLKLRTVSFDHTSPGHLAMVIYEWGDVKYLGKTTTPETDNNLPVSLSIFSYICHLT